MLQHGNALLDDHVWFEVADAFDVEIEVVWLGIVVKGLVWWCGRFPGCVVRRGPDYQSVHILLWTVMKEKERAKEENIPLLHRILLVPVVHMLQIIMRVILEPNRCRRRPLSMFLRNSLLRNTSHLQLLTPPQFTNQGTQALRIRHYRVPHPLVRTLAANDQVAGMYMHNILEGTAGVQGKRDAAASAVVLTVAVARVLDILVAVARVERNETESVSEELIGEDGRVLFHFDQVDGHGWHFGEDRAPDRVGEGEIDRAEFEVYSIWFGLFFFFSRVC